MPLASSVPPERVADLVAGEADVEVDRPSAGEQAVEVGLEEDEPALVQPHAFPDAVAEHEAGVEHRNLGLRAGDEVAVQVDRARRRCAGRPRNPGCRSWGRGSVDWKGGHAPPALADNGLAGGCNSHARSSWVRRTRKVAALAAADRRRRRGDGGHVRSGPGTEKVDPALAADGEACRSVKDRPGAKPSGRSSGNRSGSRPRCSSSRCAAG